MITLAFLTFHTQPTYTKNERHLVYSLQQTPKIGKQKMPEGTTESPKGDVLITGATGFVGRQVVTELTSSGYTCVAVSRSPERAKKALPGEVQVCTLKTLPSQVDAVIHLAGETPAGIWTAQKKAAIYNSRIESTKQLVEWMGQMATPPHTFLCASALGIYGHRPGEVLTEGSAHDPSGGFRAKVCIDWEQEAQKATSDGVRVVNLRLSNILHPEGGYLAIMLQLYRLGLRFAWGAADSHIPWISRRDTARLIHFALAQNALSGPLLLSAPEPVTQGEFVRTVNRLYKRWVFGTIPGWLMKVCLGELARAIIDSQHISPQKAQAHGFVFRDPALQPYLEEVLPR